MTHKLFTPAASLAAIAAAMTFATSPAVSQPDVIPPQGEAAPGPAPTLAPPPVVSAPPVTVESIPPATAPATTPSNPPLTSINPVPTAPAPSVNAPTTTQAPGVVYKPSAPVVQDIPVTQEASPAEEAALTSNRTAERSAPASQAAPRSEATTPAAPARDAAPRDAAVPATPQTDSGEVSPMVSPGYTGAPDADLAPPPAADEAQAGNADLSEGAIVGGAAILLLGTGALAWAALRRRRPANRHARPVVADTSRTRTVDAPATAMAPLAVAPVTTSDPVRRDEVAPVASARAPEPVAEAVAPVTPAEVHARDADTTVLERPMARRTTAAGSDLESMVAAQPDAANPFLTRRNRMRRAKYLMEHGDYASRPLSQRDDTQVASSTASATQTPSRSQPPVYDFGKGAAPQRRPGWKPATST